jgi:hypothetical protein
MLFCAPAAFLGPPENDSLRRAPLQTEVQQPLVATVQSNAIQQAPSSFLFASAVISPDGRIQKIGSKTGDLYQRLAVENYPFREPKKPPKFFSSSLPTATVRVSKSRVNKLHKQKNLGADAAPYKPAGLGHVPRPAFLYKQSN